MNKVKYIDQVEIKNKRVLMRVDFNVSFDKEGKIKNDERIKKSLASIKYLLNQGNQLILMSHLGKPRGRDPAFSMKPVAERLQQYLPDNKVVLVDDFLKSFPQIGTSAVEEERSDGKTAEVIKGSNLETVYLLENTRFYEGEKKNDPEFSKKLASLADIFVSDAFGSVHRAHASVCGVADYLPSYGGLLLREELEMIEKITKNPLRPVVAIIAGAKISTKIGLIEKLMSLTDYLLIGGAMTNTFWAAQGLNIGKSLSEPDFVDVAKQLMDLAQKNNRQLIIPKDGLVGNPQNEGTPGVPKDKANIEDTDNVLDIGPVTIKQYQEIIARAKTIIWNGPVGYFENPQYKAGTDAVYEAIVANGQAVSLVGGGDTLTAIEKKDKNDKITHISTGGGAMLELIEKGTLPGIEALRSAFAENNNSSDFR